jgi:response regulator RpfG family c-di-GMP phosphodiesterase
MLRVNEQDIDKITEAVNHLLKGRVPESIHLSVDYPDNEVRQLIEYVNAFISEYRAMAGAAATLSKGDLDFEMPKGRTHIMQSLKNLHASLRHLTWKTEQVAKGDFSQRVDFMGAFSAAFNHMAEQLRDAFATIEEHNRTLEQKVRERTKELHDSRLEIVRRLARAAEFRDTDTGLHIMRMSLYSAALGRAAGLDDRECDLLLNAAALHDVGKIGIPDQVLLKPGTFDGHEREIIQGHPAIGGEILSQSHSELVQWAEIIALTHHERWDGTGYPRALKGEDIPLIGRIVSICDVFDALTTARPYKKPWPVEETLAELERGAGTSFDPGLVSLFKQIFPRICEIHQSFLKQEGERNEEK